MRQDEGDFSLDRADGVGIELLRHLYGRKVGGHIGEVRRGNLEVGADGVANHVEEFRLGLHPGDGAHGLHEATVSRAGNLYRKLLWEFPKYVCTRKGCRTKVPLADLERIFQVELRRFALSPEDVRATLSEADLNAGQGRPPRWAAV
jgi:hypothetical protein